MAVEIERTADYLTPGRFGWDGGLGTTAWTDPMERMVTILFTQRMMESPVAPKVFTDFWASAYEARE
jgi:CubicO group peptidase (beta-lactamase class C family)